MEKLSNLFCQLGWCSCFKRNPEKTSLDKPIPIFSVIGSTLCRKAQLAYTLARKIEYEYIDVNVGIKKLKPEATDEERAKKVAETLSKRKSKVSGFVIDDFPKNMEQLEAFTKAMYQPKIIIYLTLSKSEVKKRYEGNAKDAVTNYNKEVKPFDEIFSKHKPIVIKYDDSGAVENIVEKIVQQLENKHAFAFNKTHICRCEMNNSPKK